jgi:hypothetical protein
LVHVALVDMSRVMVIHAYQVRRGRNSVVGERLSRSTDIVRQTVSHQRKHVHILALVASVKL